MKKIIDSYYFALHSLYIKILPSFDDPSWAALLTLCWQITMLVKLIFELTNVFLGCPYKHLFNFFYCGIAIAIILYYTQYYNNKYKDIIINKPTIFGNRLINSLFIYSTCIVLHLYIFWGLGFINGLKDTYCK